MEVREVNMEV